MLIDFLSGAVTMGFVIAGLFFLRFWKRTREGLFIAFAFAFWLLGLDPGACSPSPTSRSRSAAGSSCSASRPFR